MMSFLKFLRQSSRMSERMLSERVGIARETLRHAEKDIEQIHPQRLQQLAQQFGYSVLYTLTPNRPALSDCSTVAVSLAVVADGFNSWKIHFMNLVDEFRRDPDIRLLLLPPPQQLDERLKALLAAIVTSLCSEVGLEAPDWSTMERFLHKPWFVSELESLKASALVESPLAFRRHNIFVLNNFLQRA